jgi:hypothetical protein
VSGRDGKRRRGPRAGSEVYAARSELCSSSASKKVRLDDHEVQHSDSYLLPTALPGEQSVSSGGDDESESGGAERKYSAVRCHRVNDSAVTIQDLPA